MTGKWSAVLLAGSRPKHAVDGSLIMSDKALLPVSGVPMLLRPLAALLESDRIDDVLVVGQEPERLRAILPANDRVRAAQSQRTIADTLVHLIATDEVRFPVLVTTADHALLSVEMISQFCDQAAGADVAIGVVEERVMVERFPQSKRTWVGFKGGRYSGANLFAFGSVKALGAVDRWRSVEQDRKKGWKVLAALGPALLMGAVLKLRTLAQSLDSVAAKLGMTIRAVEMSDARAAIDVDKPSDLALVEAILEGRA